MRRILLAIAAFLSACTPASAGTPETVDPLPDISANAESVPTGVAPDLEEFGAKISYYAESIMTELGLTFEDLGYCMIQLNMEMDKHPDLLNPETAQISNGTRADNLRVIEGYHKMFLRKCLRDLR